MPSALIPWETCSLPSEIQSELNRRKNNLSFNYKKTDGWDPKGGDWENYKGPMTAWVRVCSNSNGRPEINKPGFVFTGGKGFYQTYGFKSNQEGNQQILGWTPDGKTPHILEYDKGVSEFPIHTPSPEIVRVEAVIQKELFRRATIHWNCFSAKQLEYMTPYMLVPGVTMILEFGWNHFNLESLVNLSDTKQLAKYYFDNPYPLYNENILKSNGNYDCVFGLVTNFEWSIDGNKISCITEITSKDRLYAGIPISSIVAEKTKGTDTESVTKYFTNIRKMCQMSFIENLKAIASADSLDSVEPKLSNKQLFTLIKGGEGGIPMKEEYWRGVFWGRNSGTQIAKSKALDHKWTSAIEGDFDKGGSKEVWVNMGFICELLNRSFPMPGPTGESETGKNFFEVDVDGAVIGAHPNLISCDGNLLLIPNEISPKYMWGSVGLRMAEITSDYHKQFDHPTASFPRINKKKKNLSDPLWNANVQLSNIFGQSSTPLRDNLDEIINSNRYFHPIKGNRSSFCFPFTATETVSVKNRDEKATYDPYFFGYFKDLYINVKKFVEIVADENIKTYVDLYKALFECINKAAGNFWDFSLVPNENTSTLTVCDNKMLPSGNNKAKPWYFDYLDSSQLMTGLSFKPKMSDAQAARVVFGESNNSGSRTVMKEENDLMDYQFDDRILSMRDDKQTVVPFNKDDKKNPFLDQIKFLQSGYASDSMYQFTIMVDQKPLYRRLVLPQAELVQCLLNDGDLDRNQRYTGLQPITVEVNTQGVGGVRTFQTFLIRNLPNPYHHNDVAYRVVDVNHVIEAGKWDTTVRAGIIPLRGYVKQKIGIPQ